METPQTPAGRATEAIMRAVRLKCPGMSTAEYNAKWSEVHAACQAKYEQEVVMMPGKALPIFQRPANAAGIFLHLPSKTEMLAVQPFQYHHKAKRVIAGPGGKTQAMEGEQVVPAPGADQITRPLIVTLAE